MVTTIYNFICSVKIFVLLQFGIRFVLDSWSEKMLNPQIDWTPDDILTKLKDFMNFINLFKKGILSG